MKRSQEAPSGIDSWSAEEAEEAFEMLADALAVLHEHQPGELPAAVNDIRVAWDRGDLGELRAACERFKEVARSGGEAPSDG